MKKNYYDDHIQKLQIDLSNGAEIILVARGNSMWPFIQNGSLLTIKKQIDYYEGDIITYEYDNKYITHRIVKKCGKFIVKGDNCCMADCIITADRILGKVIHINNNKYSNMLINNKLISNMITYFNKRNIIYCLKNLV